MAKGTAYVSKGERRNVSRTTRNMMRRYRKASFNARSDTDKRAHRDLIMNKMGNQEAKDKIIVRERNESIALQIFETYKEVGITWGACMQAAKTDWVSELHYQWSQTLAKSKEKQT